MSLKILTVDDSKSVRIIINKTFKPYDIEVIEACNGVEGLAAASKDRPDLIILDVTMPVMDGVEMLTKLKADAELKQIPVLMLTAEAGRENVLKIAKIGIRDYIVKPFQPDVIIEKASRIVDLRPREEKEDRQKSIHDEANILVVDDKPAIIQQIEKGIPMENWKVHGLSTAGETIDYCEKKTPDIIIISLSLPDDAAINLFRLLRSNTKTKFTPIFGLAVKTDKDQIAKAQSSGVTTIVTKPIDFNDLENKISKAMNLDTSEKYYYFDEDFLVINLPEKTTEQTIGEVNKYLKSKISSAVDSGFYKVIFDVQKVQSLDTNVIKFLVDAMQSCRELSLSHGFVGNEILQKEAKNYEESSSWTFHHSLDEAKAGFAA